MKPKYHKDYCHRVTVRDAGGHVWSLPNIHWCGRGELIQTLLCAVR